MTVDKSKFSDVFKEFIKNIADFEEQKPCEQRIMFALPEQGQMMNVSKFLSIAMIIAKEWTQDYIEQKCEILEHGIGKTGKYKINKIPKNKLKQITYILNFKDWDESTFYRTFQYKEDEFDQFMPDAHFLKVDLPLTGTPTVGNFVPAAKNFVHSRFAQVEAGFYPEQQYITFNPSI